MKPLVVHIYVPLCAEQCSFCQRLTCPSTLTMVNRYSQALLAEIDSVAPDLEGYEIAAVRFTGGTPLLLGGANVAGTLNRLRKHLPLAPNCEITVETVTDKLDEYNLQLFPQVGINRLEVFVPSFVGDEHRRLDAPGSFGHFSIIDTMRHQLGPENWGLHLLYGFEGQTETTWQRTLEKAVSLQPLSIRLEALTFETGLNQNTNENAPFTPSDPETPQQLHDQARTYLTDQGYKAGPLAYYARPGFLPQWASRIAEGVDQLGLGAGTASRWGGFCYRNTSDIGLYTAHSNSPEQVIVEVATCE